MLKPKHAGGRPTDYSERMLEKTIQFFEHYERSYDSPITLTHKDGTVEERMEERPNPPPYRKDLADHLGVSLVTIWAWEKKHPEFLNAIKELGRDVQERCLVQNGTLGLYNAPFSIFTAKNTIGWKDKTETESTVKCILPEKIRIELVRPKPEKR